MGNEVSTQFLATEVDWVEVAENASRSDRALELDKLGGLNRPPIARGQSFSAKLQFLAEQVKKQGDVMQEMLVPPPPPKAEAKYTGFMLATEKRAHERAAHEAERAANIAHILATEGEEAAAAYAASLPKLGTLYDRGVGAAPKPPSAGPGAKGRRPYGMPAAGQVAAPIIVAPWRLRMWAARRRVFLILRTVMYLRRGKRRNRAGNKLDNLGFMIPRVLGDDVARFVDEQRKYTGVKEELDTAKQTLEDMICRNGSGANTHALLPPAPVLADDSAPWPSLAPSASFDRGSTSRQGSMVRQPSSPGPAGPLAHVNTRAAVLSAGRLNSSRSRGSDSGVLISAATAHAAGVSPMRGRSGAPLPPPGPSAGGGGGPPTLGISTGPVRLSSSGIAAKLVVGNVGASDDTPPGSPPARKGFGAGLVALAAGPLAALVGGAQRRNSTPGAMASPPASREPSSSQVMSPLVVPQPAAVARRAALTAMPPTPASVTAQLAGAVPIPPVSPSGVGLSSMAARRFSGRHSTGPSGAGNSPGSGSPGGPHGPGHGPSGAGGLGLVTPSGPLNARISVTSAVAAKHGQIMQVQAQIDQESANLKKCSQMMSMYVNRANAAWAEAQAWAPVEPAQAAEVEAFLYGEQYRIYQADLVRRLRQGTICLQVFAGEDVLHGSEKKPASGTAAAVTAAAAALREAGEKHAEKSGTGTGSGGLTAPPPPPPGSDKSPAGKKGAGSSHASHSHASSSHHAGVADGNSPSLGPRRLSRFDSTESTGSVGGSSINASHGAGGGANQPTASSLLTPRRKQADLWTADPWDLVDRFRPGIMPQTDRIQGPTMGARILCELALAVEGLAGSEALALMPILLHINEEQMEEVVQELWSYKFFGLKRENVMLLASPLHTGYRYNHDFKVWEKEYGASVAPLGSGYGMLQTTWAGEAFIVGAEGAPEPLEKPALAILQERKVEWMVSRRVRDLCLLSREAILDAPMLAYCMALKDKSGAGANVSSPTASAASGRANIVIEVALAENLVEVRALDSYVMRRNGPAPGTGSASDSSGHPQPHPPHGSPSPHGHGPHGTHSHGSFSSPYGSLPALASPASGPSGLVPRSGSSFSMQHGGLAGLNKMGPDGGGAPVPDVSGAIIELRLAELGTPKMIENMNYLRAIRDGQMAVGLGRYLLHVPSLAALLPNASALRPKLALHEELVRVGLDVGDLTAAPRARTVAVQARHTPGVLLTADDLERVIPLLQAQDHDVAFRELLTANRSEAQGLNFVASTAANKAGGGQVFVVFVVNNRVSASAVDAAGMVAKPGRDTIHLVTCVSNDLQRADAEEVLKVFQKRLLKSMVDTVTQVLVRGVWGLMDVMDNYVTAVDAHMVVMGSQHLTSNDFNYVIGSITLSALKRLHLPILVVTANSRQNLDVGGDWAPVVAAGGAGTADAVGDKPGSAGGTRSAGSKTLKVGGGGPGVRCLSLVENHAKNMFSFLCTRLLDTKRGDRLLLAQVQSTRHLTRQQAASVRRSLDNFNLLVTGHGMSVNRVLSLEGALDEQLAEAVGAQHIQIMAVALPQGIKSLPPVLVNLLRSCRGATLVYKEPVGGPKQGGSGQGGAAGGAPRHSFGPGSAAATAAAVAAANAGA
ncbi:hypothetical protein HYH03_007300 [Edaphochlamys debaryana]|uniref:Uncharacterized protein n=1 Tax=Edaphochlamys debaryana TaxID=47281 RepID=A0A836C0I6_9CHLO|nr:hypothetical protein HYH03_007300 [Edaphochlamys debaryana]|eukprot:KAG2494533.1 hypothetical protein HYH03_007300 [Edaphochlamys debaryana]